MNTEEHERKLKEITELFKLSNKALLAVGDETRQQIIITLIKYGCNGVRVGELTNQTYLSRPAISHHLKILKEAKVVNLRKEGTKNYYFIDSTSKIWKDILILMEKINILININERKEEL